MRLHFDRALVERLIAHSKAATAHRASYGEDKAVPGLWLVGDEGVYLMSNGKPPLLVKEGEAKQVVCYAREADPTTLQPDQWWDAKRHSFGPDDGVETFMLGCIEAALATYEPGEPLMLDITPKSMTIIRHAPKTAPQAA